MDQCLRTSTPLKRNDLNVNETDRAFNGFKRNLEKAPEKLQLIGIDKSLPNVKSGQFSMYSTSDIRK